MCVEDGGEKSGEKTSEICYCDKLRIKFTVLAPRSICMSTTCFESSVASVLAIAKSQERRCTFKIECEFLSTWVEPHCRPNFPDVVTPRLPESPDDGGMGCYFPCMLMGSSHNVTEAATQENPPFRDIFPPHYRTFFFARLTQAKRG